jgi:hypothetical protein
MFIYMCKWVYLLVIIQNLAQHETSTWVVLGFVQLIYRAQDKKKIIC